MPQKNWMDEIEIDDDPDATQEPQSYESEFAKLLAESEKGPARRLKTGDKITCEIILLGKEFVYVSTGTMKDGSVPAQELRDENNNIPYKVGDKIDLYVTTIKGSEILLSPNPTATNLAEDIVAAFKNKQPIEGKVLEAVKGGVRVLIKGKTAFCPISQIDNHFVEFLDEYIGARFEFVITELNEESRNIVVSRKALLDKQSAVTTQNFLTSHNIGDVVQGVVKKIEKFGAFVEVAPALEGLVHISELSWSRTEDPNTVVKVAEKINVKILKVESVNGKTRISLSIKQAALEPWENMPSEICEGQIVPGKVTNCPKFGAFVEIHPGIEGLIPLSEMSYTKRIMQSDEIVKPGESVLVKIKEINKKDKRISLSLKDAGSDPWALVPTKFPVGSKTKGTIERRESYGLFIKIDDGVTGLLPKNKVLMESDFNFDKAKINDEIIVQVAEIKSDERRISLQIPKLADGEDWRDFEASQAESEKATSTFGDLFGSVLKNALGKKGK